MGKKNPQKEAVVISDSGACSISCLHSFGRRGIPTIVVSEDPNASEFCSRYSTESVVVPSPHENLVAYKDDLLSLARRDDVGAIVPTCEVDVYVLSKYRSEFEGSVKPLWPSSNGLRMAHDRVHLVEAARAAGVPVPETQLLDDVDDWDRELIVKPRYAIVADEYVESLSPEDCFEPPSTRYLDPGDQPDYEAIRAEMGHTPIVQEYVSGTEYAFWTLYDDGAPVATCHKRQVLGDSYAGGTSSYRETVRIPQLEEVGRALLDHINWHGFASVQFIKDADTGEFKLLEINPRIWISLACAVRAGLDFPYYYWCLSLDKSVPEDLDYATGVGTHDLYRELAFLHSVLKKDFPAYVERPSFPRAIRHVVMSLYAQPNIDYFSITDPAPFICGVRNTVLSHLRESLLGCS